MLQRGQEMTIEVQRQNIITACEKIAEIVPSSDVVLTHGNGPQVGLLAQQSSSSTFPMPLDVIGAESVGNKKKNINGNLKQTKKNFPNKIKFNQNSQLNTLFFRNDWLYDWTRI